jgi:hypothetical protein
MGGHLTLRSLGPGTALDVRVTLSFDPPDETREWRTPVFPPGDEAEFMFPKDAEGRLPGFTELQAIGTKASANGSMRDTSGRSHDIDEQLDVADWANVLGEAHQVYVRSPADTVAKEITKIRETLKKMLDRK